MRTGLVVAERSRSAEHSPGSTRSKPGRSFGAQSDASRSISFGRVQTGGPISRACSCGGGCGCEESQAERAVARAAPGGATVSMPTDPSEREAEKVAEAVTRPAHNPSDIPAISSRLPPSAPRRKSPAAEEGQAGGFELPTLIQRATSGGHSLEPGTSASMAARFGYDFSHVRVHTGPAASESARSLRALAYTVDSDIVFDAGRYSTTTDAGQRLLAHELTHVVQGASSSGARIQRQEKDNEARSAGSAVAYVSIYLGLEKGGENYIDFHTNKGLFRYTLDDVGELKAGEFNANVVVTKNNVDFTLDVEKSELFGFSYRIAAGQPNPATFFAKQTRVTFSVTEGEAPPLHTPSEEKTDAETDPNAVYATEEEALRHCAAGDLKIKTFPYRGTRFGGAPLTVTRSGGDIIVKSYVYVLGNTDFKKQTSTLPVETFIGGVRLKPNEVVRVHTYEPRWYHPNVTGSTSGDIEDEFCVSGEQMLRIGEMSDSAVKMNALLTVIDALTIIVPVGRIAGFAAKPALRGGRVMAAAMLLGLRDAAPTAFAGIASRTGVVLVEEQIVDQIASRAVSQTASHALLEFSEHSLTNTVTTGAADAVAGVGSGAAKEAVARTVTVTLVDTAGHKVVSSVTTPTGDVALDKSIDEAFAKTFDQPGSTAAAQAGQGVVSVAPEVAAGFTQAQAIAFKRFLAKSFTSADIRVLGDLWTNAARAGDDAILNLGNSRGLFDLQRDRFWRAVANNPQARALFTDAGCQFNGGAPFYMLNGKRVVMTIDHIVERQTAPQRALTASNLRMSFSRENSVVLRLLNEKDPFQP